MLMLMETFNRWRPVVDSLATTLSKDVEHLMPHIQALEAQSSATPPPAPTREEEGWAKGVGVETTTQGSSLGMIVLPPSLANG